MSLYRYILIVCSYTHNEDIVLLPKDMYGKGTIILRGSLLFP